MYKDGFYYITNIDFSHNIIEYMKEKYNFFKKISSLKIKIRCKDKKEMKCLLYLFIYNIISLNIKG